MAKYNTSTYDNAVNAYTKQKQAEAATAKKQKAAEYDSQSREAYVSSMQNQKKLNENLAASGIRGGATETSNLKLQSNYENQRNKIASEKVSGLSAIDQNANQQIFEYKQTQDAAKQSYIQSREAEDRQIKERKRQEKVEAKKTKQQNDETRFAATVSGYTNNKKINKLIKKIKKSGKNKWRISYLRAQKAVNANNKKKK